ncbi:MAG: hypothetical protein RLO11_13150 [Salinisphaeraceae bacterium]
MQVTVNASQVSLSSDVYVLRAGHQARHKPRFQESAVAFLEITGITLPNDPNDPRTQSESEEFRAHCLMGRAIAEWHLGYSSNKEPSRDIADYREGARDRRRAGILCGEVRKLYFDAKKGSVIIVPPGDQFEEVLIGVLADEPGQSTPVTIGRGESASVYRGRKVLWLPGSREKRFFSKDLYANLSTRRALITLPNNLKKEVYDAAFGSYSLDDAAAADIRYENEVVNPFDFIHSVQLLEFFSALYSALEDNRAAELQNLTYEEIVSTFGNSDAFYDAAIQLQSPGWLRLWSTDRSRAFFLVVLVAIASSHYSAQALGDGNVSVNNRAEVLPDDCIVEVDRRTREALRYMHVEAWEQACRNARDGVQSTGLKVDAQVDDG